MIIEIQYIAARKNSTDGSVFYSVRGNVTGTPVAADVSIEPGRVIEALHKFCDGNKDNPSPAFEAGVMPCIELHESHYKMADVARTYTADDGTTKVDMIGDTPVHKVTKVKGADETAQGWTLLKSIPRRAAPVKAPELADTELAALLAG